MRALQRGPGGVNDEGGEAQENEKRLNPPVVGTARLAETGWRQWDVNLRHHTSQDLT